MAWYDDIQTDPQAALQAVLGGPSEDERKQAQALGLLTAGLGILSTPRTPGMGPFTRLFQGGAQGVNAYTGALKAQSAERKQDIQDALNVKKLTDQDRKAKSYADVLNQDKPDYLALAKMAAGNGDTTMMDHAFRLHERTQAKSRTAPTFVPGMNAYWTPEEGFLPIPEDLRKPAKSSYTGFAKELVDRGIEPGSQEWNKHMDARIARETSPTATMVNLDGSTPITEDAVEIAAQQYAATGSMPGLGLGNQALRARILNRAGQIVKDREGGAAAVPGDRAGFAADTKALNDRVKFVAASSQFANNMKMQGDLVMQYLDKGASQGLPPVINRWVQAGRKSITGDPDVAAFDTAVRGLAREHQRIVTGVTSNAQMHASAQRTADELLNIAQTPEQVRAVVKVMGEEAGNAIAAGQQEVAGIKARLARIPGAATSAPGMEGVTQDGTAPAASGGVSGAIGGGAAGGTTAFSGIVDDMGYEYDSEDPATAKKTGRRFVRKNGKWTQVK